MRQTFKRTTLSLAAVQALAWMTTPVMAQNAPATDKAQSLDTVVVTGQRAAMQSAQRVKQNADEVVDSVSAEDIGKLPDRSITEVLQRVVGVSMDRTQARSDPVRYSVEGSGVTIRGLTYVANNLNGRESFSANGGRMLSFEDVPPELMAGVDVYKNPSAEQIEGAIGGLVNLRTWMPFDYNGFKASVSLKSTTSTLAKTSRPEGSALVSNVWNTDLGKFGALIDLAYSKSSTRTDGIFVDPYYPETTKSKNAAGEDIWLANGKWFPKAMGWRTLRYERTREGAYGALQWRKDNMQSSLSLFHSKYKFYWSEDSVRLDYDNPYNMVLSNAEYDGNGVLVKGAVSNSDTITGMPMEAGTRYFDRKSKTDELAWNFVWSPTPAWRLSSDLQLIKSRTSGMDSTVGTGVTMAKQTYDLTGSLPRLMLDQADIATLADSSKYYWGHTMEHQDRGTGDQKVWKGDAKFTFDHPNLVDVRFGVRLTDRKATTQNTNPSYHWTAVTKPWQVSDQSWAPLGSLAYLSRFPGSGVYTNKFDNFMGGQTQVASLVMPVMAAASGFPGSYQQLHDYSKQLCEEKHGVGADLCTQGWTGVPWAPATFDPNDPASINKQRERTDALYAQLRFAFDDLKLPVDGNVGLRVVRTENDATGAVVLDAKSIPTGAVSGIGTLPTFASFTTPVTTKNSYTNVLPSLNLKAKAADNLQFRAAWAQAVSRPDFSQLQAYVSMKSDWTTHKETINGQEVPVIDGISLTGSASGNPLLKPVRSNQLDFTGEWYFAKTGSLTFAVFDKKLKDIIVNQTAQTLVDGTDGKRYGFTLTSPVNGAKGWARGFEVSFQRYLDMLPGWMSGFGIQANYTRVNSKQDRYNAVQSTFCSQGANADNLTLNINGCDTDGRSFAGLPIANLSKHGANLAFLYDYGPISARIAYSWRSRYLYGVALNSDNTGPNQTDGLDTNPASPNFGKHNLPLGLPLWGEAYGQVDLGFSYKVTDKLSLGLDATNVTDAIYKQTMQQHIGDKGHLWFSSGPRYTASLRYTY